MMSKAFERSSSSAISRASSPLPGWEMNSSSASTPAANRVSRVEGVLGVDDRRVTAALLGLGDHVLGQGGLARRLGTEYLDDAPARDPADPERQVKRKRTGRY